MNRESIALAMQQHACHNICMRIGSLFSGIGGLELGLEWSGLGETVWQVEIDARCRAVLAKHWPHAERFEDVRSVGAPTLAPVDLICGGFPCQDVSSAGKRAGLAGNRSGLWFEYLRIVSEIRPAWVVVENVASGARAWVDVVSSGLERIGYPCFQIPLAAADVGAPHERARVFIVAASNTHAQRQSARAEHAKMACSQAASDVISAELRFESGRCGGSSGRGATKPANDCEGTTASDADKSGGEPRRRSHGGRFREPSDDHWRSPMPDMVRVVHGTSAGMDRTHSRRAARIEASGARQRVQALGNTVVPQCAEVIGHVIMELSA